MTYISTPLKKEFNIREIITVHYFEYTKDHYFHGESHDFWEFLYVDKGDIVITTDNIPHQLTSGDIIFHKPNEFHSVKSNGNESINLIAVSFILDSNEMDFFENKIFALDIGERQIISNIILEASAAFSTPLHIPTIEQVLLSNTSPFGAQQLICLYIELFLITLHRKYNERIKGIKSRLPIPEYTSNMMPNKQLIDQIHSYMSQNIQEKLTISNICDAFNISSSTLELLFHKNEHCGAIEYFNNLRLKRAKELIREGDMNFTEIALHLSYSSLQYFSKQFKKSTGMSPLTYRNSIKGMSQIG